MKSKQFLILATFFSLFFLFTSCNDDENVVSGKYAKGTFIVNEGNFGSSNGSISHFDTQSKIATPDIFKAKNEFALGDVVQSLHLNEGKGYIVVNNSTKIEVVDYGDFKHNATISEGMANPRFMLTNAGKGYISNWGTFDANFALDQSYILIVDLDNFKEIKKLNTEDGSENLLIAKNKLFVANSFTNSVSVIDLTNDTVIKTITVGNAPSTMIEDKAGDVWVACAGTFGGNNGKMVKIDANLIQVAQTKEINANIGSKVAYNADENIIFYYIGNEIYQLNTATLQTNAVVKVEDATSIYGIGYDLREDLLYVSESGGFTTKGTVFRYKPDGQFVDSFKADIGPNGFVFIP